MLFDDVLEEIGEGIFQKFIIFVCGLAILAESIASTCVPFAIVLAACDLKITIDQFLRLNAVLIFATIISVYWLGGVCDTSGRKYILSTTSIITFVGCFIASFSQCIIMLFISLFLLGLGLGGNHSATRIFVIEITPKTIRGSRFVILEIFSSIGYAATIGSIFRILWCMSRLLLPPIAGSLMNNYVRLNSWRLLFGLSGSLSVFSACLMSVFPASPRWLLGLKQEDDALAVLRKIYAINKVKHEESFPSVRLDSIMYINTRLESHFYQCNNPFIRSLRSIRIYTKHIFTKKYIRTTFGCIFAATFFFDGLVMMNVWLGLAIFSKDNCQLYGACPVDAHNSSQICDQEVLENLFTVNMYVALCSFVVVVLAYIVDKIPRKYILMVSSIIAGSATLAFSFISVEVYRISLAFLMMTFLFVSEITLRIIIMESYPTVLRCTAYGFVKIFPKLFLMCIVLFLRADCIWVFTAFGILFTLAGFFALFLPNLNMKPMQE